MRIVKETDDKFWDILGECLREGTPLMIKEIKSSVNPLLDDVILLKSIVVIGGNTIDVHQNFKLYLVSNLLSPIFNPETYSKVNIINFKITPTALQEQLLAEVVAIEAPELEDTKNQLMKQISDSKNELEQLEDMILKRLTQKDLKILEDSNIIIELENVKTLVNKINKRVAKLRVNQDKNEQARGYYRPIGERGSLIYFVLHELSKIN